MNIEVTDLDSWKVVYPMKIIFKRGGTEFILNTESRMSPRVQLKFKRLKEKWCVIRYTIEEGKFVISSIKPRGRIQRLKWHLGH